ncbi:hypothetical protein NDU88_009324 [Pleurodeles waltl]|uniref:Zinc finger C3HC4 RING-type domain-containing protein n=1 Tax=Pleurodeles waltl TaxID=8319 RepID=A0AAV7PSF4_PLEWA|nr:hypothetical protein NDU88_009324 [Pleurodeles waltl]
MAQTAAAGSPRERRSEVPDLQFLENCGVCKGRPQQPRLLPCLHSVCTGCLGPEISKEGSGTGNTGQKMSSLERCVR